MAAEHDDRIVVTQALTNGGPEVKAAAEAALAGPVSYLKDFLGTERFKAEQRDIDTTTHAADVHRYVTEAASIAANAQADAARAAEAAARARNAATEAAAAADEARRQVDQAKIYADQANESANQAQKSAEQAAESARQARNAAQSAQQAARSAANSAVQARASATRASTAASSAQQYAERARAVAVEAGKDAAEAAKAASDAAKFAADRQNEEEQRRQASGQGQSGPLSAEDEAALRAAGGQDLVGSRSAALGASRPRARSHSPFDPVVFRTFTSRDRRIPRCSSSWLSTSDGMVSRLLSTSDRLGDLIV
nr:hypothetical protein [Amycolatopsis vastitatis]